LPFA